MSECGAGEGLLWGQARRMGDSCSKALNFPNFSQTISFLGKKFLEAKVEVKAVGGVACFWLVGGECSRECSRNLSLSLKLPLLNTLMLGRLRARTEGGNRG